MADINISNGQMPVVNNFTNQAVINNKPIVNNDSVNKTNNDDNAYEVARKEELKEKLREELLENVIAISEDGDTVQVSDESSSKADLDVKDAYITEEIAVNDNKVSSEILSKTNEAKERQDFDIFNENVSDVNIKTTPEPKPEVKEKPEIIDIFNKDKTSDIAKISTELEKIDSSIDKEDTIDTVSDNTVSSNSPKITSFKGYSDTQLKQLYLDGVISKYNYDKEMESRDTNRENIESNNESATMQVMGVASGMERAELDAQQLKAAFGNNSNETPDPSTRIEIMSALQDLTKLQ